MISKKKMITLTAWALCLVPISAANARNGLNDMGAGMGRAMGHFAHGTGKLVNGSGHVIVHGTGSILKTTAKGTGNVISGAYHLPGDEMRGY
jgi:hypothetical protein